MMKWFYDLGQKKLLTNRLKVQVSDSTVKAAYFIVAVTSFDEIILKALLSFYRNFRYENLVNDVKY